MSIYKILEFQEKEEDMTNNTAIYVIERIQERGLSIQEISEKLNIPIEKLIPGTKEKLSAKEFLELCAYLHIRPEEVAKELGI